MLVVLVNNGFVAAGGLEYYSVCLSAFDVVPGLAADYWSIMLCKPPLDDSCPFCVCFYSNGLFYEDEGVE